MNKRLHSELIRLTTELREVAMPAFLHYFNNALLASKEQIVERVKNYLSPFDEYFRTTTGISASDELQITEWIGQSLQGQSDNLMKATEEVQYDKIAIEERAKLEG